MYTTLSLLLFLVNKINIYTFLSHIQDFIKICHICQPIFHHNNNWTVPTILEIYREPLGALAKMKCQSTSVLLPLLWRLYISTDSLPPGVHISTDSLPLSTETVPPGGCILLQKLCLLGVYLSTDTAPWVAAYYSMILLQTLCPPGRCIFLQKLCVLGECIYF